VSLDWLKLLYPDPVTDSQAQSILHLYRDQALSYVDAYSFAVLEAMRIKNVFSFDTHFHIIKKIIWPRGC
jgi:predicted nucleic acid-binding protein